MMDVTRESTLELMDQLKAIENELAQLGNYLTTNGITMDTPLVDSEGYPRADIDLVETRRVRGRIRCLQNDHKALSKKIEDCLAILHSEGRTQPRDEPMDVDNQETLDPFAKVTSVTEASPAHEAGLLVDDLVLKFGSVTVKNFGSLADVGTVVSHSIYRNVTVLVKRNGIIVKLTLMPRQWAGQGLLGCNVVPVENVDR